MRVPPLRCQVKVPSSGGAGEKPAPRQDDGLPEVSFCYAACAEGGQGRLFAKVCVADADKSVPIVTKTLGTAESQLTMVGSRPAAHLHGSSPASTVALLEHWHASGLQVAFGSHSMWRGQRTRGSVSGLLCMGGVSIMLPF